MLLATNSIVKYYTGQNQTNFIKQINKMELVDYVFDSTYANTLFQFYFSFSVFKSINYFYIFSICLKFKIIQ